MPLRILVCPAAFKFTNMGDVAMLRVAVARLRELWPDASIAIFTDDAEGLRRHCGDVQPIPHDNWFADHFILGGRVHRRMPQALSRGLVAFKVAVHRRQRWLEESAIWFKLIMIGKDAKGFGRALQSVREATAIVISGCGGIGDNYPKLSRFILTTVEAGIRRGLPTAMFSHGLGPIRDERLWASAGSLLPLVDLIALREGSTGPSLLHEMGVDDSRTLVTGDDAIELAYAERTDRIGSGVGVSMRVGADTATGVEESVLDVLRPVIQEFARQHGAALIPVPISLQRDPQSIDRVTEGFSRVERLEERLDTPAAVSRQIGHCRIVVAGAYHATVFALAQGIPVVALAKSDYYVCKIRGLANMFGVGCEVINPEDDNVAGRLKESMDTLWNSAERVRGPLLERAADQIRRSREAYLRFGEIVASRKG